ncbi:hypothetical protein EJB05_35385 [Eragrostis curvula]|uniref:Uncharacterized protein n=1 Tax=Eragrostis curvula TaxID=38414 RepID=A0A5J9U6P7_9POAL|nr:hypothetical protein EJB05_35385 [Eragrostis curvula]
MEGKGKSGEYRCNHCDRALLDKAYRLDASLNARTGTSASLSMSSQKATLNHLQMIHTWRVTPPHQEALRHWVIHHLGDWGRKLRRGRWRRDKHHTQSTTRRGDQPATIFHAWKVRTVMKPQSTSRLLRGSWPRQVRHSFHWQFGHGHCQASIKHSCLSGEDIDFQNEIKNR